LNLTMLELKLCIGLMDCYKLARFKSNHIENTNNSIIVN